MTDYLRLKGAGEVWTSPPIYTHPQGYKMCLEVDANGDGSGEGTHVSVFICIMKGKHDDQLQWPFEGDIIIEPLNWREDKGHHENLVSLKYWTSTGLGLGCPQFISHSFLSYNPTTNIEYLQDDCLL